MYFLVYTVNKSGIFFNFILSFHFYSMSLHRILYTTETYSEQKNLLVAFCIFYYLGSKSLCSMSVLEYASWFFKLPSEFLQLLTWSI